MDEHKECVDKGPVFLRRGLPFSDGAHGQPEGELALGTCDWRELAVGYSTRRFYSRESKVGVGGAVYVLEGSR